MEAWGGGRQGGRQAGRQAGVTVVVFGHLEDVGVSLSEIPLGFACEGIFGVCDGVCCVMKFG